MKKIFTLAIVAAMVPAAVMADDATATNYTMASLAAIEDSGVISEGDGVYVMTGDITIPEGCTFSAEGVSVLKMADGVTFTIDGYADFQAPETRMLITRASESDNPRGINLNYESETEEVVMIANVDFEYVGLRNTAVHGFNVDNCTFRYATGALSSIGAIALGNTDACFTITNSIFEYNEVPAIGCAANYTCGIHIENCTFTDNNSSNTNKPQLNLTVGGSHNVTVKNCTITGTGRDKVGGIAVGNLMILPGDNNVIIEGCSIKDNRYGITGVGPMNMQIRNNTLVDNNHETNAMNGGSGISLSGYGYELNAVVSGNHIENSLWGITIINCNNVNLGEVGNSDSPGLNVFLNNGNGGMKYDLYNNQANTVYAQNNTWSVDQQTEEEIETVIYHKHDNSTLGEVIFMPAYTSTSLSDIAYPSPAVSGGRLISGSPVDIYSVAGVKVMSGAVNPSLSQLAPGVYVAVSGDTTLKFVVR